MTYNLIFSFEKTPQGLPAHVYFEGCKYELRYSDRVSCQEVLHDEMQVKTIFTAISVHPYGDGLSNKIIRMESLKWIKRMAALSRPSDFELPTHQIIFGLKGTNGWPLDVLIGNTWHRIKYRDINPLLMDNTFE